MAIDLQGTSKFKGRSKNPRKIFEIRSRKRIPEIFGPVVQWIPACRQAGNRSFELLLMMYFVYAIKSKADGRIYVGMCSNIENRIYEHNIGKTKSTKGFRPWLLIYKEQVNSRAEARIREKYLKSGVGKEFLRSLVP